MMNISRGNSAKITKLHDEHVLKSHIFPLPLRKSYFEFESVFNHHRIIAKNKIKDKNLVFVFSPCQKE